MKNILIGSTGSIGALNLPQYLIELKKEYEQIKVVPSASCLTFISERSIKMVIGDEVYSDRLQDVTAEPLHVKLAEWADIIVILPATANTIAKIANGISDNLLTTIVVASRSPVVIVPNMNESMWNSIVVQKNVERIKELGHLMISPIDQEVYIASHKKLSKTLGMPTPTQLLTLLKRLVTI